MVQLIKRKYHVSEPHEKKVHCHELAKSHFNFELQKSNLFFIGPRASGKSTLAKEVAQKLYGKFVDTDDIIVQRCGKTIAELVQDKGWNYFRNQEHKILQEICIQTGQIIATGGGIVLMPENRKLIKNSGTVFYLMAEIDELVSRLLATSNNSARPNLTNLSLKEEVASTLHEREPLYFQCLDFILQACKPLHELVADVITALGQKNKI